MVGILIRGVSLVRLARAHLTRCAPHLTVIASLFVCAAAAEAGATVGIPPRMAIERAVAQRIGGNATVTLSALDTSVGPLPGLVAIPDPAARSGQPVRFQLFAAGSRVGNAVATVRVQARHARAARAIARDEVIALDAVTFVDGEIPNLAFRHLPGEAEIAGLKARRNIAPGEPMTDAVMVLAPLVRSGDSVTVVIRIGNIEAQGAGIASGSGHVGDTIQIMQRGSRTMLKARITGPAAVEVTP